jgi:hypothetical protein
MAQQPGFTPPPFLVNDATWTAYTPRTMCKKIRFGEVGMIGTCYFYVRQSLDVTNFETWPPGTKFPLNSDYWMYPESGAVCWIKLASGGGSVYFDAAESQ